MAHRVYIKHFDIKDNKVLNFINNYTFKNQLVSQSRSLHTITQTIRYPKFQRSEKSSAIFFTVREKKKIHFIFYFCLLIWSCEKIAVGAFAKNAQNPFPIVVTQRCHFLLNFAYLYYPKCYVKMTSCLKENTQFLS